METATIELLVQTARAQLEAMGFKVQTAVKQGDCHVIRFGKTFPPRKVPLGDGRIVDVPAEDRTLGSVMVSPSMLHDAPEVAIEAMVARCQAAGHEAMQEPALKELRQ